MAIGLQLSDGNPDGVSLGQSAADLVSFYGATPIVKPAATAQSTVTSTAITDANSTVITTVSSTSLTTLDLTKINAAIARIEELRVQLSALATRTEAIRVLQNQTRTDLINLGLQKGSI